MESKTYVIDIFDDAMQIVHHMLYKCDNEQNANKKAKLEADLLGCLIWMPFIVHTNSN